jgi:hypothetical protein
MPFSLDAPRHFQPYFDGFQIEVEIGVGGSHRIRQEYYRKVYEMIYKLLQVTSKEI